MKNAALIAGLCLWISVQAGAQTTPSPNTHAPEQNTQTFPQGEPSAQTDSLKSKMMKGTQSDRNARKSSMGMGKKNTTTTVKRTKKTVRKTNDQ